MSENYQKQVETIRKLAAVFLDQIAGFPVPPEIEAKVDKWIDELELELAKDAPDLVTIRDLIELIRDIIDGARPIRLH